MTVDVPQTVLDRLVQEVGCSRRRRGEALWGLAGEGMLYRDTDGPGSGTDNWQWRLSADGKLDSPTQALGTPDPDCYLNRIRRAIPDLTSLLSCT